MISISNLRMYNCLFFNLAYIHNTKLVCVNVSYVIAVGGISVGFVVLVGIRPCVFVPVGCANLLKCLTLTLHAVYVVHGLALEEIVAVMELYGVLLYHSKIVLGH